MSSPRLKYRNSNLEDLSDSISPTKSIKNVTIPVFDPDVECPILSSPISLGRRRTESLNYFETPARPQSANMKRNASSPKLGRSHSSPKLKHNKSSPTLRNNINNIQLSNTEQLDVSKRFKYLTLGPIDIFSSYTAPYGSKEKIINYPRKLNIRLGVLRVRQSSESRIGAFEVFSTTSHTNTTVTNTNTDNDNNNNDDNDGLFSSYPVGFGPWSETRLYDPFWTYNITTRPSPNLNGTVANDMKIQYVYDSRET
eukprot:gene14850-31533_t